MICLKFSLIIDAWKSYLKKNSDGFVCCFLSKDQQVTYFIIDCIRRNGDVTMIDSPDVLDKILHENFSFGKQSFLLLGQPTKKLIDQIINSGNSLFCFDAENIKLFGQKTYLVDLQVKTDKQKRETIAQISDYVIENEIGWKKPNINISDFDISTVEPFEIRFLIYKRFLSLEKDCKPIPYRNCVNEDVSWIVSQILSPTNKKDQVINTILKLPNPYLVLFILRKKIYKYLQNTTKTNKSKLLNLLKDLDNAEIDTRMFYNMKSLNDNIAIAVANFFCS